MPSIPSIGDILCFLLLCWMIQFLVAFVSSHKSYLNKRVEGPAGFWLLLFLMISALVLWEILSDLFFSDSFWASTYVFQCFWFPQKVKITVWQCCLLTETTTWRPKHSMLTIIVNAILKAIYYTVFLGLHFGVVRIRFLGWAFFSIREYSNTDWLDPLITYIYLKQPFNSI